MAHPSFGWEPAHKLDEVERNEGKKNQPKPVIYIPRMNENFNISENNVISVGLCQGSTIGRIL